MSWLRGSLGIEGLALEIVGELGGYTHRSLEISLRRQFVQFVAHALAHMAIQERQHKVLFTIFAHTDTGTSVSRPQLPSPRPPLVFPTRVTALSP